MRVVSGTARGCKLQPVPGMNTRPTTDRVKENVFNLIQDQKIFFKKTKEKFKQEHPEVARYEKATAYLAKHPDDKDSTQKELQEEQETLLSEIAELKVPLTEVQEDLKKLRDIRYWVRKATPGTEESKEPPKKQPIKEVLLDKADEKKAQRTAPAQTKHKQQDMEL